MHTTASHRAEQSWFASVARALLAAYPTLRIDVTADRAAARRWQGDPRLTVRAQRPWPDYRRDTADVGTGIMVAPLLPSTANAARAPVKRIDAARSGAALIVSDERLYDVDATEHALGMAIALDRDAWIAGLGALIGDPDRRLRLAAHNRARILADRSDACPLFVPSDTPGLWRLAPGNRARGA